MHAVLAIDLGTTGVKVAVFDELGRVLATAAERHATTLTSDGGAEQDAEAWWQAIGRCSRACVEASGAGPAVEIVTVTSQYMSALGIDAVGRPLTPVHMWIDHRGAALRPGLHGHATFGLTLERHGLVPLPNDNVAHVAVMRSLNSRIDDQVAAYVEPADALTARLTGRITATATTAFGFMATDNRRWGASAYDPELLAAGGLAAEQLAPLVSADEPVGTLTSAAAAHLAISQHAVVMPGTVDSITSAVGTGAIDHHRCGYIIGTTAVVATHVPDNRNDLAHSLAAMPSPLSQRYLVMAENGVGGKALDQLVREVFYADDPFSVGPMPDDAFERATRAAAAVGPGSEGVLFLPWLVGSMAPDANDDVRAGFLNLDLSTMTRRHLTRAVMEGVALNAAWLMPHVEALTGVQYERIVMGGGGAASWLWCQIVADVLGKSVDRLAEPGLANARGAALLALSQCGHLRLDETPSLLPIQASCEPDRSLHDRYSAALAVFCDVHAKSAPLTRRLNA